MKFRVFWDVAPCSHVGDDRHFRGVYCLHHQGGVDPLGSLGADVVMECRKRGMVPKTGQTLMMEAVRTSEMSVNFNVTTRRYIPEKLH
jgi:hypothetical protein